jgi:proline dehydrogenase
MNLFRNLILKTSEFGPLERVVKHSALFRPLVRRFIAGNTLEEAMVQVEKLVNMDLYVTLDYLGENTTCQEEATRAKNTYIEVLRHIAQTPYAPYSHKEKINLSIKLTQCGLDISDGFAEQNYREVVQVAQELDNFVRVDMESSEYTERTLRIVERVFRDYPNTGTVLQSYLHRTLADTEFMIHLGARVRLVKGAYLEPHTVAYTQKSKVDEMYLKEAKMLLKHGNYPAIATQDEKIIRELLDFVRREKIPKENFEFQMLYGIRRDLQHNLRAEDYYVRVYVPYGEMWYPYFTRRLAERPANMIFLVKSLFKG